MASLQLRGKSWRVYFHYQGQQHTFTIGEVDAADAAVWKAQTEELLRLLRRQLVSLPPGCPVEHFMFHRGKPPEAGAASPRKEANFAEVRDSYLKTFGGGAVEDNTLYTAKIHLAHLARTLGEKFVMSGLTLAALQKHIDRRRGDVAGVTIRKEIDTLRSAWHWAQRMGYVEGDFPSAGLVYPKSEEKLPFMTWAEIERRIKAGGDPEGLWECLYLREAEITAFLDFAHGRKGPAWVYPMCVLAAHTGARRSEIMRAERQDVDFEAGVITIREKKKVRGRLTTRRVPISTRLQDALAALPDYGPRLFGKRSVQAVQKAFMRLVGKHTSDAKNPETKEKKEARRRTKWSVVKGYHVLRHSFISVLAARGVDQRVINELAGHTTEAMARRYRHLIPDV
jgi:integrase